MKKVVRGSIIRKVLMGLIAVCICIGASGLYIYNVKAGAGWENLGTMSWDNSDRSHNIKPDIVNNWYAYQTTATEQLLSGNTYFNDIVKETNSRITYAMRIPVSKGNTIALVAAGKDNTSVTRDAYGNVTSYTLNGGSNGDADAKGKMYWCPMEYSTGGNCLINAFWLGTDTWWTAGESGHGVSDFEDSTRANNSELYIVPIFRVNTGNSAEGANFDVYMSTVNITNFEHFEFVKKPFNYTFNLNGGNYGGDTNSVTWNRVGITKFGVNVSEPTRDGYKFNGWKITSGGTENGIVLSNSDLCNMLNDGKYYDSLFADATFEAQWAGDIDISYSTNGGTGSKVSDPNHYHYGDTFKIWGYDKSSYPDHSFDGYAVLKTTDTSNRILIWKDGKCVWADWSSNPAKKDWVLFQADDVDYWLTTEGNWLEESNKTEHVKLEFIAQWDANITIKYSTNGGTGDEVTDPTTYHYGGQFNFWTANGFTYQDHENLGYAVMKETESGIKIRVNDAGNLVWKDWHTDGQNNPAQDDWALFPASEDKNDLTVESGWLESGDESSTIKFSFIAQWGAKVTILYTTNGGTGDAFYDSDKYYGEKFDVLSPEGHFSNPGNHETGYAVVKTSVDGQYILTKREDYKDHYVLEWQKWNRPDVTNPAPETWALYDSSSKDNELTVRGIWMLEQDRSNPSYLNFILQWASDDQEVVKNKVNVEHYVMNTKGEYPSTPTKSGKVGEYSGITIITHADIKDTSLEVENGIMLDTEKSGVSTTIAKDTTIKLYYKRLSYDVTLNKDTTIQSVSGAGTYYYDSPVTVEATSMFNSTTTAYEWVNWTGYFENANKQVTFNMPAQDVTLTANGKSSPIKHDQIVEVRFEKADGTFTDYSSEDGVGINRKSSYGDTISWSRAADSTYQAATLFPDGTTSYSVTAAKTTQVTVYRQKYTITLTKDDNTIKSVTGGGTYRAGQSVSIDATLKDTTSEFTYSWSSWSGDLTSTTKNYSFAMPEKNIALTANGSVVVNTCKQIVEVRFENANGSFTNYSSAKGVGINDDYNYGATVSWSREADDTYKAASITSYTVSAAKTTQVTVYRRTFTVSLTKDDNINSTSGAGTFRVGQSVTIDATAKSNTNQYTYSWSKWTKESGCTNFSIASGQSLSTKNVTFTMPTGNVSLKANGSATVVSHTVTYNYSENGGSSASRTTATVNYGAAVDLSVTATKSGMTFVGWNTDKNATTGLRSLSMGTSDVTLYAIYKKDVTANFIDYKGSTKTTTPVKATYYNKATSASITVPTQNNYTGWTKKGWNSSTTGYVNKITTSKINISSDATYYGLYEQTLTLSYNANNGSSTPDNQTGTRYFNAAGNYSNPSFTLAAAIERTGYAFEKWAEGSVSGTKYDAGSNITISANTTMYATYAYR